MNSTIVATMLSTFIIISENPQDYHHQHLSFSFTNLTGLFGAMITVLITTLDDSVWLMPFVAAGCYRQGSNCNSDTSNSLLALKSRLIHAGTFLVHPDESIFSMLHCGHDSRAILG